MIRHLFAIQIQSHWKAGTSVESEGYYGIITAGTTQFRVYRNGEEGKFFRSSGAAYQACDDLIEHFNSQFIKSIPGACEKSGSSLEITS